MLGRNMQENVPLNLPAEVLRPPVMMRNCPAIEAEPCFPDTYSGADKAALASVSVIDSSHQHKRPMARGFQELLTLKGRTRGHDDCRVVGSIHTILMGVIAAEFKLVPSLGLPSSRLPSCHGVIRF